MKNVPNISTMHNFPFWLQQDLRSIYQFWKQPTSIPYSLFFAVKKNLFIHSVFHINFFHFSDKTETIFFHQSNSQNDQFWPIRERQEIFYVFYTFFFYTFALTLYIFRWYVDAFYVIIATHCHFNVVNLYIYHCILVFLYSSVDW